MSDLAVKLSEVMGEVGYVQKDATNDFLKYRYASAEAVLKKVNAALSSRGVAIASHAELLHHEALASGKGTMAVVKLGLDFTDGTDCIHVEGLGSGMDSGDKAILKANTAALKYAVANAFLISWGDDPEADAKTDESAESKLADWLASCEEAASGPIEEFRKWWPARKDQIKAECGEPGAASVYKLFCTLGKKAAHA